MKLELTKEKDIWFKKIDSLRNLVKKDEVILEFAKDHCVLDVGCVGQDIDYNNPEWLHKKVKGVADSIIGVDIDVKGINLLNQKGYEVYHYDYLKSMDKEFNLILMLDVIEHVNDPVTFLNDYSKFLKKDGKIIITTPNSNRAINFINIFFANEYSLNYEHTFWFCPKTFLEVIHRTKNLYVSNFFWLRNYNKNKNLNWKQKIKLYMETFLVNRSSNFSPNFMFVLEKKI